MELFNHQKKFLEQGRKKCLLAWGTGTGKTITALSWAKLLGQDTLVICPKALRQNWLRNVSALGVPATVLTKEEMRRDWEKLGKFNVVIYDEAHYAAGMKSQMAKNFRKYLKRHKTENILLLTATPYLSTPWNIYVLAGHLGYQWGYFSFKTRFFQDRYIGRRVVPEVRPGMEKEIANLVKHIGDVVHLEDCIDVPEQIFETEYFELTPTQTKAIKENVETNPIVRWTKNHQIEQGVVKGNEYEEAQRFESHKLARILELVEENDKIIIVCRYNLQIDDYRQAVRAKLGREALVIRGDVKNRDEVVQEAERSKQAVVLIQGSCSEGYELPSFPLMVFASLDFSYKNYAQLLGRILRINHPKKNVYLHLLVKDGIDEAVYGAMMKKKDFDIAIYGKIYE